MSNINNSTKKLIVFLSIIVALGLIFSYFYYNDINNNVDPRLIETQKILSHFDNINKLDSPFTAIDLMTNLELKLNNIKLYKNSFEHGVVLNNRASVYLMLAIYDSKYQNMKDSLFNIALIDLFNAEKIYINWMKKQININEEKQKIFIKNEYLKDIELFKDKDIDKIVKQRIKDINLAKIETPRRLSVVYSNIAIIKRHTNKTEEAISFYSKSLKLWPKNHEARNNLNTLCGKEREELGTIEKIFPSKRDKN